jgi:hypothetical protein
MDLCCPETDFMFPMLADVYYPIISQNDYGQPQKRWVYDRTIVCNATNIGGAGEEEIKPEIFLQYQNTLVARSKVDIRISSNNDSNALTNVLISNIRNPSNVLIYKETAGPRSEKGTIYELATLEPFINPFGTIEYYKMVWRRSDSQAVTD